MGDDPRLLPMAAPRPSGGVPVFERIGIVGLGLIGGSIALAARDRWPGALVIGVDHKDVLEKAMVLHAIDVAADDLLVLAEATLVILAAPVRQNIEALDQLAEQVTGTAVVTDTGSTKVAMLAAARHLPPRLTFVGGHPLAGAARGGIEHARPDLFAGRPWLLTPADAGGGAESLARVSEFVTVLGAAPRVIGAAEHDHLLAYLSHLPQLTVSALMQVVGEATGAQDLGLAGRGLLDTTRLASSPAGVWRDICATNGAELAPALDRLITRLSALRQGLSSGDDLEATFESANRWRDALVAATDKRTE